MHTRPSDEQQAAGSRHTQSCTHANGEKKSAYKCSGGEWLRHCVRGVWAGATSKVCDDHLIVLADGELVRQQGAAVPRGRVGGRRRRCGGVAGTWRSHRRRTTRRNHRQELKEHGPWHEAVARAAIMLGVQADAHQSLGRSEHRRQDRHPRALALLQPLGVAGKRAGAIG